MVETDQTREQLQRVGRYMMENKLAWGTAGNISARLSTDTFLISASGTYLGELEENDFVECSFDADETYFRKPSKELPMHQAIYEERPDISAVLHASPFYSTLAACSDLELKSELFVESMYYLERIERVPYYHPGSRGLAEAVREKAKRANILLLENHGVLIFDTSIQEARMGLETLEMASRMVITAKREGIDLLPLSREQEEDFLISSGYKPRRKWEDG
jgi:3-dehydro-4-phosphotetronate decarboxylase